MSKKGHTQPASEWVSTNCLTEIYKLRTGQFNMQYKLNAPVNMLSKTGKGKWSWTNKKHDTKNKAGQAHTRQSGTCTRAVRGSSVSSPHATPPTTCLVSWLLRCTAPQHAPILQGWVQAWITPTFGKSKPQHEIIFPINSWRRNKGLS